MSVIPSLPVNILNGTVADATQVMANFNAIVTSVNANAANNGLNSNITVLTGLTTALSSSQGGLGVASPTAHAVLVGEGSSAVVSVGPGTAGQVLTSQGAGADPAFVSMYPVGSLYFNASNATNPATLLGFGTWTAIAGLCLVGVGTGTDSNSNTQTFTAGTQVGEYTHTLTTPEMPSHTHADGGHFHGSNLWRATGGPGISGSGQSNPGNTDVGYANIQNTGGGLSHNNVQPSIGIYIWQRTA